jgi:hypothetical protein
MSILQNTTGGLGGWVPFRVELATGRPLDRDHLPLPNPIGVPAEPGRPYLG